MYGDAYHGLPAELRLMIWTAVLADAFSSELRLGDLSHRAKLRIRPIGRSAPPAPPEPKHKIEATALAILQLNYETRSEVLTLFQPCTILDLSNAKEYAQISTFLDITPPWLPRVVQELVIDRSQIKKDPDGLVVHDVSIAKAEDLYTLIDKMTHLDRLVFVIDACRWQENNYKESSYFKRHYIDGALRYLWRVEDTEAVLSRLDRGKIREVKLFISHPLYWPGRLYRQFVSTIRDLDRAGVKTKHWRMVDVRPGRARVEEEYSKYSFLQKFQRCGFTIVTLTKS